jgi:hypothetical protein
MIETQEKKASFESIEVADVRRSLAFVRKCWEEQTPHKPMFTCTHIPIGLSTAEFCFKFVMGHHTKRHVKSMGNVKKVGAQNGNGGMDGSE